MSNNNEIARRANNELSNALNNEVDQIVANFRLPVEPSPREATLRGFEYVTNFFTGGGTRTRKQQHEDEVYKGAVKKWKTKVNMEIARSKGKLDTLLAEYSNASEDEDNADQQQQSGESGNENDEFAAELFSRHRRQNP